MLIAIGDVHGDVWKLRSLLLKLHELPLEETDRLIFLGDYVDRGPESALTLDLLIQLRDQRPNTVFLRGNHDQGMLDVRDVLDPGRETHLSFDEVSWWFSYGGRETMGAYGGGSDFYQRVPEEHWAFLQSTTLEHREGGYIFVHAGLVPPGDRWFERDDPRMWIRGQFLDSRANFGGIVVYGHTPTPDGKPRVESNKIGVDTGVGKGGPLTAAVLTPNEPAAACFIAVS